MLGPIRKLASEMFTGANRRTSIVLLTSAVCLAAWHLTGNYHFWLQHVTGTLSLGFDPKVAAGIWFLFACVLFLGIVPLLVVKFVLRESLSDYGIQWGNLTFATICCVLVAPLVIVIGYGSAQSPEFQAMYPINPVAKTSAAALAWHLVGQIFWYAAWEFHFRGFLQHGMAKSNGITTGIWVQTLASTLRILANLARKFLLRLSPAFCRAPWRGARGRCWLDISNTGCWGPAWISFFIAASRDTA